MANLVAEYVMRHGRSLRVRYEDITRDPNGELARISGFWASHTMTTTAGEMAWNSVFGHALTGNRMRKELGSIVVSSIADGNEMLLPSPA